MGLNVVQTDADDFGIDLAERENIVAERAGLGRASWRIILGVEIERDPLAAIILKGAPIAILILHFELRRRLPDFESGESRGCHQGQYGQKRNIPDSSIDRFHLILHG